MRRGRRDSRRCARRTYRPAGAHTHASGNGCGGSTPPRCHIARKRPARCRCAKCRNSPSSGGSSGVPQAATPEGEEPSEPSAGTVTLAEGAAGSKLTAFVILPFVERDAKHPKGFFLEVLRSLITPAAASKECGFTVKTANRQGSDMIQSRSEER